MNVDGSKFRNSDLPAVEDRLGTEKHRQGLLKFMSECSTPMTIAVQGDWGTGKTSLMKQLEDELKQKHFGCTLWFDTWQFAVLGEQDRLLMDLIEMLYHKLEESLSDILKSKSKNGRAEIKRSAKRIRRVLAMSALYLTAETAKAATTVDFPNVFQYIVNQFKELDRKRNGDYVSYPVLISGMREDLTKLINSYLGEDLEQRLYFFIDDLDRLEPVRAVELLEGIKNFLDIPRCVFLIAVDTNIIKEGLRQKYGENMRDVKQSRFFDKIIQIPYKLPVHNYDLQVYMEDVLKNYDGQIILKYVNFLCNAGVRNPRTIKRCVNFCLLYKCMDQQSKTNEEDSKTDLQRFALKMLELEQEELYWQLLAKAIEMGEDYVGLKEWFLEYVSRERSEASKKILDAVNQVFDIGRKNSIEGICLFAYLLINSTPSNINLEKYISYAQMFIDISSMIIGSKLKESVTEIALSIEKDGKFRYDLRRNNMPIKLICNDQPTEIGGTPLVVFIYNCPCSDEELFAGVKKYRNEVTRPLFPDGLIYKTYGPHYEIWNIRDTSSPDAPIYKVLRNAGIIT